MLDIISNVVDNDVAAENWDLALKVGGVAIGLGLIGSGCYLAWKRWRKPAAEVVAEVAADVKKAADKAAQ